MLEILRKNASSWITKVLFLLIIVVFIFFFGWTKGQKGSGQQGVVAEINGEAIRQDELARAVQNQLDAYQQMYKDKLPDELVSQFQKMALQSLIEDRIVRHEAEKMGLRVSDAEILKSIQNNPNLKVKGVFDPEQYRTIFRPWFLGHNGIDYEEYLRHERLKDKFREFLLKAVIVSDFEVKNHYTFNNTKLGLTIIAIRAVDLTKNFKPSEATLAEMVVKKKKESGNEKATDDFLKKEALRELTDQEGKKAVAAALAQVWPAFSGGGSVASLLKQYHLTSRNVPLTPLSQTTTFFPGEDDTDAALKILLQLSPQKPYPSSPIQIESSYYLVKLTAYTAPNWTEFEKNKVAEKEKLEKEFAAHFYDLWYQQALNKAKIKIHEDNPS